MDAAPLWSDRARRKGLRARGRSPRAESGHLARARDAGRDCECPFDLAFATLMSGDGGAARAVFADSLRRNRDLGWNENVMYCLVGIAGADVGLGLPERAARLLGAVFAVSETMDIARIRDRYANEVE